MNPTEVEYLGEKQQISIIPTFNSSTIHLISGDVGPFRAGLPLNVPLWIGIHLKVQRKCKIQAPDWMDVTELQSLKDLEISSEHFVKMPSDHYMIEGKLLLGYAYDDIPKADEIRTIIKDIWDIRMSKLRRSLNTLVKNGSSYAALDNLTLMEINTTRPLLPHSMDQMLRLKKGRVHLRAPTQNTTLSFLNSSRASHSSR
ncbi:hypothetical protein FQR65_LT06081 [Abscondita terminalis]|nr:hypothetical protein FQR65_LT06081 [Abscondita terminalis]